MKKYVQFLLLAACSLQVSPSCFAAKSAAEYWDDAKDYVASPFHWDGRDWLMAGGTAAGIALASTADSSVRDHFAPAGEPAPGSTSKRDSVPLILMLGGTFATGLLRSDDKLKGTGWDMGEAVVLSGVSAQVFKLAFGRLRPSETTSPDHWGEGGASFPSGHVTAAFAAAQVFADEMPRDQWGWRVLAYTLAGATAYGRMEGNAHWLSDTVAGAALGISTGRFVSNRDEDRKSRLSVFVSPWHGGAMVQFVVDTNQ